MTTNPYAGQEYEQVWAEGHEQGHKDPTDLSPPLPASLQEKEYGDANAPLGSIWLEGVKAGVLDAEAEESARQGEQVHVDPVLRDPEHSNEDPNEEARAFRTHVGVHAGVGAAEIVTHSAEAAAAGEIAEGAVVASSITSFFVGGFIALLFATSERPEEEHATDQSALTRWFAEKCTAAGVSDLYLAYCKGCGADGHGGGGDALAQEGWWHGALYKGEHERAFHEAKAHMESDPGYKEAYKDALAEAKRVGKAGFHSLIGQHTGLLHYKASDPGMLEISTLAPPELNRGY